MQSFINRRPASQPLILALAGIALILFGKEVALLVVGAALTGTGFLIGLLCLIWAIIKR